MAVTNTNLGNYSPEDVSIILTQGDFVHVVQGYTDGTFVSITREVPASVGYVGADLTGGRVIRDNRFSMITLTLSQISNSTDVLSALLQKDTELRSDEGLFTISIKDNLGRSVWYSDQAFIGNNGDADFGTEMSDRDWTIEAFNLTNVQGGNSRFDADTASNIESLGGTIPERWQPRSS